MIQIFTVITSSHEARFHIDHSTVTSLKHHQIDRTFQGKVDSTSQQENYQVESKSFSASSDWIVSYNLNWDSFQSLGTASLGLSPADFI